MKVGVVVLFPEYLSSPMRYAPIRKALEIGALEIRFFSPIDFAPGPKDVEDYRYGGGAGMLLKVNYFAEAIMKAKEWVPDAPVILLSPSGKRLNQEIVLELSKLPSLVLCGGHYKGVDARVLEYVDMEISLGDYVLSSGELAALVVLDAVSRLLPGVLSDRESAETDSIHSGILEPPLYTRPREYEGRKVPDVLLSGHHAKIKEWMKEYALRRTLLFRPDLLSDISEEDRELLKRIVEDMIEKIGGL